MRSNLTVVLLGMLAWWTTGAMAEQILPLNEVIAYDREYPAVGYWVGSADKAPMVAITIGHGEPDGWSIEIFGAPNIEGRDFTVSDAQFAFSFESNGDDVRFDGTISEDGQVYAGTANVGDPEAEEPDERAFTLYRMLKPLDLPNPLAFSGNLQVQTMAMPMTLVFARTPGGNWVGHLDVPMQMAKEFPLASIKQDASGAITAILPGPANALIEVRIDELEKHLTGTFRQSGMEMAIDFARDEHYSYAELKRPQNPKPPYPYEEREITAPHPDGFSLGGTLTIPNREEFGAGPFPVAVLISGSGQQDRNESLLGHQPFLIIADSLTRHGIAVMRYDDRGVGASRVEDMALVLEATSADFATDTLAVVEHLRTVEDLDAARIGLIGHSEGGMIAPMVGQATDDIAFMVLLAGPGVVGHELLALQAELFLRAAEMTEEDIEASMVTRRALFQAIRAGENDQARELLGELIMEERDALGAELSDEDLEALLDQAETTTLGPWMQFFLNYDPAPALRATSCPVLALNGTLDLQVWHEQNLDAIKREMNTAGRDVTIIRYEGLNHLFQPAETGAISEYVQIETTFEERVLADMVKWIKEQVGGE